MIMKKKIKKIKNPESKKKKKNQRASQRAREREGKKTRVKWKVQWTIPSLCGRCLSGHDLMRRFLQLRAVPVGYHKSTWRSPRDWPQVSSILGEPIPVPHSHLPKTTPPRAESMISTRLGRPAGVRQHAR